MTTSICWPAGYGHVPGIPAGAPARVHRKVPSDRYQNAYSFLLAHPRWVAGRLPKRLVVQTLREKFKLTGPAAEEVFADAKEAVALAVGDPQ